MINVSKKKNVCFLPGSVLHTKVSVSSGRPQVWLLRLIARPPPQVSEQAPNGPHGFHVPASVLQITTSRSGAGAQGSSLNLKAKRAFTNFFALCSYTSIQSCKFYIFISIVAQLEAIGIFDHFMLNFRWILSKKLRRLDKFTRENKWNALRWAIFFVLFLTISFASRHLNRLINGSSIFRLA